MTDSLGLQLSRLLIELEPRLLNADTEATAECIAILAGIVGCLFATVRVKSPDEFEEALARTTDIIRKTSERVANKAMDHAGETPTSH